MRSHHTNATLSCIVNKSPFTSRKAYRRLYLHGVVIIEDFFDADPYIPAVASTSYPPALFSCTEEQADWVSRAGVSRDVIFDGVFRSSVSGGYDSIIVAQDRKKKSKEIKGPDEGSN